MLLPKSRTQTFYNMLGKGESSKFPYLFPTKYYFSLLINLLKFGLSQHLVTLSGQHSGTRT